MGIFGKRLYAGIAVWCDSIRQFGISDIVDAVVVYVCRCSRRWVQKEFFKCSFCSTSLVS